MDASDRPLRAPFPYFGGKSKIAADVWRRLGDPQAYVEPFAGSLAVLLARPNAHQWWRRREAAGDRDGLVVNFYRAARTAPGDVARLACWPVTEADLTARHLHLVRARDALADRLAGDPAYFDLQAAAWWLWGVSAWVGGEWCSGLGPWHPGTPDGPGVYRKLPMVAGSHGGKGIHAALPPGDIAVDASGYPAVAREHEAVLLERISRLANRLHRVRLACGDWSRLTNSAARAARGHVAGVFLDPPYDLSGRRANLYGPGDRVAGGTPQPHEAAREWALDRGTDPATRIAYCGYDDRQEAALFRSAGWTALRWSASGGYGLQADNAARANRAREVVWFSPHCLNGSHREGDAP